MFMFPLKNLARQRLRYCLHTATWRLKVGTYGPYNCCLPSWTVHGIPVTCASVTISLCISPTQTRKTPITVQVIYNVLSNASLFNGKMRKNEIRITCCCEIYHVRRSYLKYALKHAHVWANDRTCFVLYNSKYIKSYFCMSRNDVTLRDMREWPVWNSKSSKAVPNVHSSWVCSILLSPTAPKWTICYSKWYSSLFIA